MVEFVSADAALADYGNKAFLVGVAVEVDNGTDFDDYFFEVMGEFCEEFGLDPAFPVLESEYLLNNIPSYEIRDASDQLAANLLQNPAIRRIHVTIGWFDDNSVQVAESTDDLSGIRFMKSHLQQYFPVVTIWDYLQTHRSYGGIPDEAWVDSIQGHITRAWNDVGSEFDLNVVPHGDVTYPSLSTADYIATHLKRTLPREKNLDELPDAAAGWLIEYTPDEEEDGPYVQANAVNEEHRENIVADYPYTIKGEQHYPHPVLFIYDDMFGDYDEDILPKTDFHSFARRWAQEKSGCVVNLRADRLPAIVKDGDRIVFTSDDVPDVCDNLQKLNPTKDIGLMTREGLIEMYLDSP